MEGTELQDQEHANQQLLRRLAESPHPDPEVERALIVQHLGLIEEIVRRFSEDGGTSFENLMQVGYVGLLNALYHYDPAGEADFRSYATRLIESEIIQEERNRDRLLEIPISQTIQGLVGLPGWVQGLDKRVRSAIEALSQEHGEFPTVQQLSDELNIEEPGILEILKVRMCYLPLAGPVAEGVPKLSIDVSRIRGKELETFKLPIEDRVRIARAVDKVSEVQQVVIRRLLQVGEKIVKGEDEREYLERLEQELEYLRNFITAITRDMDLKEILSMILRETIDVIRNAEAGSVMMLGPEGSFFEFKSAVGWNLQQLKRIRIPRDAAYQEIQFGGGPAVIDDVEATFKQEELATLFDQVGLPKSSLSLPIKSNGRTIGYLNIDNRSRKRAFDTRDLETAKQATAHLDKAISRFEEIKELTEQRKRLGRSYLIGQEMSRIRDTETLFNQVLQRLKGELVYDYGAILLRDGDYLTIKSIEGLEKGQISGYQVGDRIKIGVEGITGWVAEHGEPVLVNDVTNDPRYVEGFVGIRSELTVPIEINDELLGVLEVESLEPNAFTKKDLELMTTVAGQIAVAIINIRRRLELEDLIIQTVTTLAKTIEKKDQYTDDHCRRLAEMATKVGVAFELPEGRLEQLRYAALLHDVGKIGVSDTILGKEGELTDEEWQEVKRHPTTGREIIGGINRLRRVARIVEEHQERWDGTGYPRGLAEEEISLEARIIAVVDAYDAMTSTRPYREALPRKIAIEDLRKNAGLQFDAQVVDVFLKVIEEQD
ncbi:MAG: HD domain-containing phosphohydrolase [Candidatus Bipolaricaulia bacterium]